MQNPALVAFLEMLTDEFVFGQVMIRRGSPFQLRHVDDTDLPPTELNKVEVAELRDLAQTTDEGEFRPLKSAPNLSTGWLCEASETELGDALDSLYPGALADWFASRKPELPVTHYRDFVNRQTGMYRISQHLSDAQAAVAIRATCAGDFCVKRRLWTVDGLPTDGPTGKSIIACLEPCPLLLEFARKSMRLEQQDKLPLALGKDDWETIKSALETALQYPPADQREADFGTPGNPRRVKRLLEILHEQMESKS